MKNLTKLLFFIVCFTATAVFSQTKIEGTILDDNGPLPGANVVVKGTSNGTTTDFDGNFSLEVNNGKGVLDISFVGMSMKSVPFNATGGTLNLGNIELTSDENLLEEVVLVGAGVIDLAENRQTPIAVSTIKIKEIQTKIGTQDITATMVNTPSVYVAGQAGGFGDSRIAVRGFGQDNTAFLLNGQPINGMEDGLMYWSNWSGMSDIANGIQIQRGLGSSKLAISSVGGTVNFVTKATEMREGGYFQAGIANDSYFKTTLGYSTGRLDNGWGVTAMLSHWQGDGYNEGTKGQGQNYFLSIGYKLNESHNFNFLITGAPQWHDQNFTKPISDYLEYGKRYNNNWGTLDGKYETERRNFYHKPVANLNWDWLINEKSSLSTVLYASWGRGGGTGNYGSRQRTEDGYVDFDAIVANNIAAGGEGMFGNNTYLVRASMNNHNWYGLVSNYETELSENLTLNVGTDLRTYYGTHFRQVENFLELNSWTESRRLRDDSHQQVTDPVFNTVTESFAANPWTATFNTMDEDQRIDYDNSERISYAGLFGQVEYATDMFSVFFQGAVSTQSHQRFDRYDYLPEYEDSKKVNNTGFNVKGGGSYKFNPQNSVYFNTGYYSRQPYHDNIYLNFTNEINPLTQNEKIFGLEAGYSYRSSIFNANVNLYRTSWKDRVTTNTRVLSADTEFGGIIVPEGTQIFTTNEGVEQLHSGIEIDFGVRPITNLNIKGFLSVGNWEYQGDVFTTVRDEDRNVLEREGEDVDGGKVGDAAQFTAGLGLNYQIIQNLSVDFDWRYYDNLYATVSARKENLELPSYHLADFGVSYRLNLGSTGKNSLDFRLNINNAFDTEYLSELRSAIFAESGDETYDGINVRNQGYFGLGRTWNTSVRFNF